jgi:hypothetical protein
MRRILLRTLFVGAAAGLAFLSGCSILETSTSTLGRRPYTVVAHRPQNPSNVRVKVSLQNRMVYVMEGNRPLLVTPTTIGKPGAVTPTGNFHVTAKIREKRSSTYGFWANANDVRPGTSNHAPGSGYHYVGYPMAYWVEFAPAYGFHQGAVWPIAHSHGCLRLHPNAAPKFFALVHTGTPVNIAQTQPEDATIGREVRRPQDYNDPDPPASYMISSRVFAPPSGPLFVD